MADLAGLIERVGKLTGPDREVDEALWTSFIEGAVVKRWSYVHWSTNRVCDVVEPRINGGRLTEIPAYTASLDAATALVERCLPGWYWRTGRTSLFPNGWAYISRTHPSHCDREDEASCADGKAANPAIALLLALLRALQSQEGDDKATRRALGDRP